jgi:hypothetical protein
MIWLLCFVLTVLASPFKSKSRLEAENAALRHQLIVLRRKVRGRAQLTNNDRWFFVQLYPSSFRVPNRRVPELSGIVFDVTRLAMLPQISAAQTSPARHCICHRQQGPNAWYRAAALYMA